MPGPPPAVDPAVAREVYERLGGNVRAAARELGVDRKSIYRYLAKTGGIDKPLAAGQTHATRFDRRPLPASGTRRYILTAAQNNTPVWEPFYRNLRALQEHREAELLVASFTYNTNAFGRLAVKRGTRKRPIRDLWYDPEIEPLLDSSDRDIELAPGLVWCGRMNTLPTAGNPLSGFETYTGTASGIFPHAKIAARSVAQGKATGAKLNYTTGAVTKHNYIQKRAGIRAEFHHAYGALLVEVEPDGTWYARQLNADRSGSFYDLDLRVKDGKVRRGRWTEVVTWGDIHVAVLDPAVREIAWGRGRMLDELRPRHQFFHDTLDFRSRNHHDRGDAHRRFQRHVEGGESVEQECRDVVEFLARESRRPWCRSVVVDSNHDGALARWLREADYRADPVNALFFLRTQLATYEAIARSDESFHIVEHALRSLGCPEDVRFLREDESFTIGGVDYGDHGHLGPDGTRGTPSTLARQGRKANTAHTHSAGIYDGLYVAGVCGRLDMGWNPGPSSWSHTQVVTYKNSKRALVTFSGHDYRARDK